MISNFKKVTLIALLASIATLSHAQDVIDTRYVTDSWRFETRESPCWDCTITRSLSSGTELSVLETDEAVEGWQFIRTESGHEGWMSERYMQDTPSSNSQLEEALAVTELAIAEQSILREQFALLSGEIRAAGIEIEMIEVSNDDGTVVIETPRVIGNLATVGTQNEELLRSNQLLQNELDLLNAEVERLADESWKGYFIYGGVAVFGGVLLCLILTRIPRKKGYSEWA